jgi:CHAD domain-containing protein
MADTDPKQNDPAAPQARKARTTKARTLTEVSEILTGVPLQLNFWPDEVRGVPNAALRGALFSISKEREMAKKRQRLATVDGYQIMFKGERYNQRDLDLWEMLLHIGRQQPYGKHIEFIASDLLKALGRATGGGDYEELKEDISRLMSGVVEITFTDTQETFIGSLIHNAYRQETTQRYALVFDEKMRKLYDTGYTHVDWEQRTKLKGDSLAKWLHGFYATHASPLRYKVETIKELCGSTTGRLTDFRIALRKALDKLKDVGAITSWAIDPKSDLVTVRRKASMSQKRHLENKQAAKASAEFSDNESGTLSGFDSHQPGPE